jgi:hypothetical protein
MAKREATVGDALDIFRTAGGPWYHCLACGAEGPARTAARACADGYGQTCVACKGTGTLGPRIPAVARK